MKFRGKALPVITMDKDPLKHWVALAVPISALRSSHCALLGALVENSLSCQAAVEQ